MWTSDQIKTAFEHTQGVAMTAIIAAAVVGLFVIGFGHNYATTIVEDAGVTRRLEVTVTGELRRLGIEAELQRDLDFCAASVP